MLPVGNSKRVCWNFSTSKKQKTKGNMANYCENALAPKSADGTEHVSMTLVYGREQIPMTLELCQNEAGGRLTFGHIQQFVTKLTGLHVDKQKLIYKGERLMEPGLFLTDLGITNGSKINLIASRLRPVDKQLIADVQAWITDVDNQVKDIDSVYHGMDGLHRGYMGNDRVGQVRDMNIRVKRVISRLNSLISKLRHVVFTEDTHFLQRDCDEALDRAKTLLRRCEGADEGLFHLSHFFGLLPPSKVHAYEKFNE